MTTSNEERTMGIDFGTLAEETGEVEYPVSSTEFVERYGECEIHHVNGSQRVADVLGKLDATFESDGDLREAILGSIGMDAVGRKRYTGRGGSLPEEQDQYDGDTL